MRRLVTAAVEIDLRLKYTTDDWDNMRKQFSAQSLKVRETIPAVPSDMWLKLIVNRYSDITAAEVIPLIPDGVSVQIVADSSETARAWQTALVQAEVPV